MTEDIYPIAITALMPLMAGLLVVQVDPYQALVIRGILGAIAALVYSLFGAADIALTEALVGTMLSITLYAIAVRSSMRIRLGILQEPAEEVDQANPAMPQQPAAASLPAELPAGSIAAELPTELYADLSADRHQAVDKVISQLQQLLEKHHVRVELCRYETPADLTAALKDKDIHIAYSGDGPLQTRLQQLDRLMQGSLPSELVTVGAPSDPHPAVNFHPVNHPESPQTKPQS